MTVAEQELQAPTIREPAYVGGLDGLRALAVAAVIVYHFAPSLLPAGFLGVDVFFVVSGFLIARLVVTEIGRTGNVSLGNFWARRARRLLPALATVTVVVCIAASISFSDTELHDVRSHALGTLFYCANWVFIVGKGSYFAFVGRPSPFLHMWSLAVEEQFYVALPLLCFAARRVITRRPVAAAGVALLAAIASTIWMWLLVSPSSDPSRAYLGSDSHAMGLLVGVALGILAATGRLRVPARTEWLALVAFVAVLLTMRVSSDHTYNLYRGGFLLFSAACGIVIVTLVMRPDVWLSRALATKPLVEIGLRSYSLYLWHWPVRVFVTARPGLPNGPALFFARLAISVVLSEVSFQLIERPFRVGAIARRIGSRGAISYFAACVLVASALVVTVAAPPTLQTSAGCPNPGATRVDLFGDSTALVFGLGGCQYKAQLDLSVGGAARLGCGMVLLNHVSEGRLIPTVASECDGWQQRWTTALQQDPHAVIALMAGAWDVLDQRFANSTVKFGTKAWTDIETAAMQNALEVLTAGGRTVYVFEVPCYGAGDPNYPLPERQDARRINALNDIYAHLASSMPNVQIVHWRELVCPNGKRAERIDGVQMWQADDVHLTRGGARIVWQWWLKQLGA